MKTLKIWVAVAATVAMAGTAQGALVSLSDGTVQDTNTNLIWLQNWNVNGAANWATQKAWAEGLDFAHSDDWRLPEIGEYDALFATYDSLTTLAAFTGVQSDPYWSGTMVPSAGVAWWFKPSSNSQSGGFMSTSYFAVAVRPGDVPASVPEPQTLALALLALGATVVARRRRSR